jgi:hypothetical protein
MPTRFESIVVTCLPSVQPTAFRTVPFPFDGGTLRKVRILIPAGHAGLTGIALGYGGNNVIPLGTGAFYFGDDREIVLDYTDNVPGVSWAAFVFNTDSLQHSWEVDMDFDDADATNSGAVITPVSSAAILAAGTAAMNGP